MASSPPSELGRLLTGSEARELADRLTDGDILTAALRAIGPTRRNMLRPLLEACGTALVPVLRAIEGARSTITTLDPLWTLPGHLARGGPLTYRVTHLVGNARRTITCSTYNFQRTSGLWDALHRAVRRPELAIRVYLDTRAAVSPTAREVAEHLHPAAVLQTIDFGGLPVRNHAKFLAIDHRFLLVTSANFSWSAEHGNVELGVLIDNPNLVEAVEAEMRRVEALLYAQVNV